MSSGIRLHRYWFPTRIGFGIGFGATAWTEQDARRFLRSAVPYIGMTTLGPPIVDIDIRDLDPRHVLPNIGVCSVRGVWYPNVPSPGT
ncbi:hypothetical protein ASE43_09510 [Lysobacter sp. Root983]|nr:hypothetical protein ASE43_09510 [Lysobacter sp. Root983]